MSFVGAVLSVLIAVGCVFGSNVKFHMNNCIKEELILNNFHNYTGVLVTDPPQTMDVYSQSQFEYSYATRAIDGALLDGNLNYYPKNQSVSKYFHYYIVANNTGGLKLDIQDEKLGSPVINATFCADIELNQNALPSVIGAYFWLQGTDTYQNCAKSTPVIEGCRHFFNCSYPNWCNATI